LKHKARKTKRRKIRELILLQNPRGMRI